MTTEIKVKIGLDASGVQPGAKRTEAALQGIARTGQVSAGQISAAMRGLPAQFTDIASSLAGGQNPFLVLLQQGGQIRDQFGGIGNAVRGIAAAISPVALAVGGVAAAVAGAGAAVLAGIRETERLRDVITLTGNAAGLTASRLDELQRSISGSTQQTAGQARDTVLALAETGRTSAEVVESQARAAARIADLTGKSGREIAASFAAQLDAPARFAAKLNESYNFLTVAEFKRIQALEKAKRTTEAANLTNDLLLRSLESQRDQLGLLERGWDGVTKAISRAWQAAKDFGKPDTTRQLIDQQFTRLQGLQQQLSTNLQVGRGNAVIPGLGSQNDGIRNQIQQAQRRLFELQRQADIEAANATARSEDALSNRQQIGALVAPGTKPDAQPLGALQSAREQYRADFLRSEKAFYDELAEQDKKLRELARQDPLGDFIAERVLPQAAARADQRLTEQANILQALVDENARAGAELLEDERERGRAIIELDRSVAIRRLQQQELSNEALLQGIQAVNERADIALRSLNKQLVDKELSSVDAASQSMADSISNGILEGFRRGNSLADIFLAELKAQFAKTVLTPLIRPAVEAGNSALDGLLKGIALQIAGGGITVDYGGIGLNNTGGSLPTRGGRAAGGPVSAGGAYTVGERGVEVLQMGSQSGRIIPNHALGGATTLAPQINVRIDARSDQAQVVQLVNAGVQQGMRATMEQLRLMGVTR